MPASGNQQDLATLYEALKPHVAKMRRDRRLDRPPADSVTVRSALCGSELALDAQIVDGRVEKAGHRVRACSLGQAATSILVERAPGLDLATTQRIRAQLEEILAGRSTQCDWPELEIFQHVKDVPARHDAVLLPFKALERLFARAMDLPRGPAGSDAESSTAQE